MIGGLAALILLSTTYLVQTSELPDQISLRLVELGGNITLKCPVSETEDIVYWYKQSLGYMVQTVASVVFGKITISSQFNNQRFTAAKEDAQYFLNIRNISKEDEATYFCHNAATYSQSFVNGIFLAVNDLNQQKSVYVEQNPVTASVQPGSSVTFKCSLLSKNKENPDQCPGEHSVYWFRSGSGETHPSIIYTQRNSSDEQEKRSCFYSLSKTIRNSSDDGTYYCAVVTCGQILFGGGTQVETKCDCDSWSELQTVVLVLGVLLACCVTVIIVLILYINRGKVCQHCIGAMDASDHLAHQRSTVDQLNNLDGEAEAVNYAALDFSTRKVNRGKKKRENTPECVYSAVRADNHNQQQLSV